MGVVFLSVSVALTGTMRLAATDEERRDIGGALADALNYFEETSPYVKLVNVIGPWSGVIDGLGKAIYDRAMFIAKVRQGPPMPAPPQPSPYNGRGLLIEDEIIAPDPGAPR